MALIEGEADALGGLLGGAAADTGGGEGGGGAADTGGGFEGGEGGGAVAWLDGLSADPGEGDAPSNRDYIQAKGFKDADGLVKAYREAERAIHAKGAITVPGADAKPEAIAAFRTAIGVPDKADGYEVKAPEGVTLNEPLIARMREAAFAAGTPKGAFEGLVADYIQSQMDEQHAETTRQDKLAADWVKAQGADKDAKIAAVSTAMRTLGLSAADGGALRSALGADRALDLMAKLGGGMSEETLLTGGKGRFGISGAEAQAEIDRLKTDPEFVKKAMVKGTPENARYTRLNQAAAESKARETQTL